MTDARAPLPISLVELPELRRTTEEVSRFLRERVERHLKVLRPLLAPTRVLGKFGGGSTVPIQDQTLTKLQAGWGQVRLAPFQLPVDLDVESLTLIENRPEIFPFEYQHEARGPGGTKTIRVESPVRWMVTYPSGYSLSDVCQVVAGRGEKRPRDLSRFVVHSMVMASLVEQSQDLVELLRELRITVTVEHHPSLGRLPLVVLGSPVSAALPSDETILAATGLSGVPSFIELIDRSAIEKLGDPLKEHLGALLG